MIVIVKSGLLFRPPGLPMINLSPPHKLTLLIATNPNLKLIQSVLVVGLKSKSTMPFRTIKLKGHKVRGLLCAARRALTLENDIPKRRIKRALTGHQGTNRDFFSCIRALVPHSSHLESLLRVFWFFKDELSFKKEKTFL
eukprot:TRINITY_DN7097_c0_g2_i3.p1 TRINITY_DN7097_c0_g2~~TRINITY_DN7097_c0_g2_i3.p1  ORF type:complete len:140 (+),score=2.54 TRINITY_DN7097_c0_g2_i3:161-580(+)